MSFRSASLNLETFQEFVLSEVSSSPVADVSNLVSRVFPAFAQTVVSVRAKDWTHVTLVICFPILSTDGLCQLLFRLKVLLIFAKQEICFVFPFPGLQSRRSQTFVSSLFCMVYKINFNRKKPQNKRLLRTLKCVIVIFLCRSVQNLKSYLIILVEQIFLLPCPISILCWKDRKAFFHSLETCEV